MGKSSCQSTGWMLGIVPFTRSKSYQASRQTYSVSLFALWASSRQMVGIGGQSKQVAAVPPPPIFLTALCLGSRVAVPPAPTIAIGQHQRHAQGDRGGVARTGAGVCVWPYALSWRRQIFSRVGFVGRQHQGQRWAETGGYQSAGRVPTKGTRRLRPRTQPGGYPSSFLADFNAVVPNKFLKFFSAGSDAGGHGRAVAAREAHGHPPAMRLWKMRSAKTLWKLSHLPNTDQIVGNTGFQLS